MGYVSILMVQEMKPLTQILHITRGNEKEITITCPQCTTDSHIKVDVLSKSSKPLKARCRCGCKFRLILDNDEKKVVVTCPQCKRRKNIKAALLAKSSDPPKARCGCGCKFRLIPDSDIEVKKVVKLSGMYTKLNMSTSKEYGLFDMQQLSLSGLTFNVLTYHSIQVGEFLGISFVLNNTEESEIRKTVIVKHVDKQRIQVDFCHQKPVETALIRYVRAS